MTTAHDQLTVVTATLANINQLTKQLEEQLLALRDGKVAYAEAVHSARAAGAPFPQYSGTPAHSMASDLVSRLAVCSKNVGFVSNELLRFTSH
jgi:hypothetical protein